MTRWELHVAEWANCTRCFLHERRVQTVLAKGSIPCDVLLVGEAPGPSENVTGEPFIGPVGQLLDRVIARAVGQADGQGLRLAFTNLVACIPLDDAGKKFSEPDDECVEACKPRLVQLVEMAQPRLIVTVGQLAADWLTPGFKHSHKLPGVRQAGIVHPAAILRAPLAAQGLMTKRSIVTLAAAFAKLIEEGSDAHAEG